MDKRKIWKSIALTSLALVMSACAGGEPLSSEQSQGSTIVIGSQAYYSNEIIAEIYAQALENAGFSVQREFQIGQREVYLPEIVNGKIDLFPEYTGTLLQYWQPDTTARLSEEVYNELKTATPEGLRVLDQSPATDQDSYTVTREFAEKWGISTIEDLSKVSTPLVLGANSEGENRPVGPAGLKETYGIEVGFSPIEDSGGPLTVQALKNDSIQIAIIYTANPLIAENDLVSITDTKGIFLASHVVPLASNNVSAEAEQLINKISAAMSPEDLIELNTRSVKEQLPAATIAKDWLTAERIS